MKFLIYPVLLFLSLNAFGANEDRELRLTQEVLTGFIDGKPLFLNTKNNKKFLSLLTQSEMQTKGVVIVIHGRGFHANWHNVTQPVRTLLPEYGWDTLSLQMPVLNKDAEFDDYVDILPESTPRIEIAINTLKEMGYKKIYIVSHSCGGQMMLQWLKERNHQPKQIDGFINISLGMSNYKRVNGVYPPLHKIKKPILDIYGEDDIVKHLSQKRWDLIVDAGNKQSKQLKINNAGHMFIDKGDILAEKISHWLNTLE